MAAITKMNWWTSGPYRPLTAAMRKARKVREDNYRKLYAKAASAIMTPEVELAEETGGYLLIHTSNPKLRIQLAHPDELRALGGENVWSIGYGSFEWGQVTYEDYPADTPVHDIAFRIAFLMRIVATGKADGRSKNSPRMRALVSRLVRRTEPTPMKDPTDRAAYLADMAS